MDRQELETRWHEVRSRLARAAEQSGRDPAEVKVVAVTKGHPFGTVEAAVDVGFRDLGENRLDELEAKAAKLHSSASVRWHMVGHVQRRKVPRLWGLADLVHSLDSVALGERIARTAPNAVAPMRVLAQVNTSGEAAKGGFEPERLLEDLDALVGLGELEVVGLMTMAPHTDDERVLRRTFSALRELHEKAMGALAGYRGTELSMGMSNDYEVAVEEGSTLVRLGTALFGERPG